MPPLRDLALFVIIGVGLPLCFFKPWIGVLYWCWIGYMNPHRMSYDDRVYNLPIALAVAVATTLGTLFMRNRPPLPRTRETYLLIVLWIVFFLSTMLAALYPDAARVELQKVSKVLFVTFLMMILFQDRKKIGALFWVTALSIGVYGIKGGLFTIATGGQNQVLGPPDSFISGNTEIALALNMVLPMFHYLRRDMRNRWIRYGLSGAFLVSAAAVVGTYSRGGLLGLGAVIAVLFLRARSKFLGLLMLAIALPIGISKIPDAWLDRMQTIKTYEEDQSAMERIYSWKLAYRIAADRPFLGAGFRAFTSEVGQRYVPEFPQKGNDAHNIFFQVLAEHGYAGLAVYVALMGCTLATAWRIIRRTRGDPTLHWMHTYALIVEASLVAFLVSGFFLSLSYFDLYFQIVAMAAVLATVLAMEERRGAAGDPEAAEGPLPAGGPSPAVTAYASP